MKHKDILLTWEEFLVILLVHFVVSAKEFSTRTSYIVLYIYIYMFERFLQDIVREGNI